LTIGHTVPFPGPLLVDGHDGKQRHVQHVGQNSRTRGFFLKRIYRHKGPGRVFGVGATAVGVVFVIVVSAVLQATSRRGETERTDCADLMQMGLEKGTMRREGLYQKAKKGWKSNPGRRGEEQCMTQAHTEQEDTFLYEEIASLTFCRTISLKVESILSAPP
jgi:hypothetical protein